MFKYDENVDRLYGIELVNDLTIRKTAQFSSRGNFEWIQKLCNHLIANPHPMIVPIYRFEVLEEIPERGNNQWGVFKYAYEMMRLPKLSREEKHALNTTLSHRYRPDHPDLIPVKRDYLAMYKFMQQVCDENNYTDLHDGNFLKDQEGNYRIIDLEGFARFPGLGNRES
jgi:hypothetical protein